MQRRLRAASIQSDISDDGFGTRTSATIAVCIHAFYLDVFTAMLPYIHNIPGDFDLFVTCTDELRADVEVALAAETLSASVLVVQNLGMDVLPFLEAVRHYKLHQYAIVLKLHTKNSSSEAGRAHLHLLLNLLLGSRALVSTIVEAFAGRTHLLMVGPNDLYRSSHYMAYNNRKLIFELCNVLHRPTVQIDWGFFAGTMFWIRGANLQISKQDHAAIVLMVKRESVGREFTGRDGSTAHALERVWGALAAGETREVGLTYRCDAGLTRFALRVAPDRALLEDPMRRLGASDVLPRWTRAQEDVKVLTADDVFDAQYYRSKVPECDALGIDPELHFALYGDLFSIDPSETFSSVFYRLSRPDVFRKGVNTLAHYLTFGRREGYTGTPTAKHWYELATSHRIFDETWYGEEHGSLKISGLSAVEHYQYLGRHLQAATSPNFDPLLIPALCDAEKPSDPLSTFLQEHYLAEQAAYNELARVLQNNDYELVPGLVSSLFTRFGVTGAPLSALALAYLCLDNWEEAEATFSNYWRLLRSRSLPFRHQRSILPLSQHGNRAFSVAGRSIPVDRTATVCVYTALFGDIDELPPVFSVTKRCRFVCFTDTPGDSEGWEYQIVEPQLGDPNLDAKRFKVLRNDFLAEFDYSLFVDANTLFLGRLDELIESYLLGRDLVMFAHPERSDVFAETAAIIESERHSPPLLLNQVREYRAAGLPSHSGLIEASFIWRARRHQAVDQLMADWWSHIIRYSRRDQLSLGFLIWKNGFRPPILPREIGTARENRYFVKLPHIKLPHSVSIEGKRRPVRDWVKRADVWFLYGARFVRSGSSVLRGDQLSQILKPVVSDERGVFYTSFDEISEKVVVLTKGYLSQHGVDGVCRLKARRNILLADFVDAQPDEAIVAHVDVLIASSLRAYIDYRKRYPHKRVHHVTHHVDLRIKPPASGSRPFSVGYFGELVNTISNVSISKLVDFVPIDTSTSKSDWIDRLNNYNFHYAVRQERGIDHHKPFLKGFVAAHCRANMLIQANAGDAKFYLGEDYPYLLPAKPTEVDVVDALHFAAETMGGREWNSGLAVMEEVRQRSSLEYVRKELLHLLNTL